MSDIFSIRGASGSANSKTEIYLILIIFILSGRSSLYIISPKTFKILKDLNLAKSNLLLGHVIQINIIFVLGVFRRKYTLFFFLRVGPQTLFLSANFFICTLKKIKFYRSSYCNSWISSTFITICGTSSSHFLVSIETLASNPQFIKNGVLLIVLCTGAQSITADRNIRRSNGSGKDEAVQQ